MLFVSDNPSNPSRQVVVTVVSKSVCQVALCVTHMGILFLPNCHAQSLRRPVARPRHHRFAQLMQLPCGGRAWAGAPASSDLSAQDH